MQIYVEMLNERSIFIIMLKKTILYHRIEYRVYLCSMKYQGRIIICLAQYEKSGMGVKWGREWVLLKLRLLSELCLAQIPLILKFIAKILEFEEASDPKPFASNAKFTTMEDANFISTLILLKKRCEYLAIVVKMPKFSPSTRK